MQSSRDKLKRVISTTDPLAMKKELERIIANKKAARTGVSKRLEEEKKQATLLSGQIKTNQDILTKLTADAKGNDSSLFDN